MYCKKCGAPNDKDAVFCSKCGTRLLNVATSQPRPNAGAATMRAKKNSPLKFIIGGISAIVIIALAIMAFTNIGKDDEAQCKAVIEDYLEAGFSHDGEKMFSLFPKTLVNEVYQRSGVSKKVVHEYYGENSPYHPGQVFATIPPFYQVSDSDKWSFTIEITDSNMYDDYDIQSIEEGYSNEGINIEIDEAKSLRYALRLTVNGMEKDWGDLYSLSLIKVNGHWYINDYYARCIFFGYDGVRNFSSMFSKTDTDNGNSPAIDYNDGEPSSSVEDDENYPVDIVASDDFTIEGSTLIKYTGSDSDVVIPDGVTVIGASAFYSCDELTNVTIPKSVTTIGASAFHYCNSLTSITIPKSVTSIGANAFSWCSNLTTVAIPKSVIHIGDYAFGLTPWLEEQSDTEFVIVGKGVLIKYNGSDRDVKIPKKVTSISGGAFDGCSDITSVTIPTRVVSIGTMVFSSCSNLTNVVIPQSVTMVGMGAFQGTPWLDAQSGEEFVIVGNDVLIQYNGSDSDVIIPQNVASIGGGVFLNNSDLTSVTIPDGVTLIGERAFSNCNNLTSVTIPDGVIEIGGYAFAECPRLAGITIPKSVTSIGENIFGRRVQAIKGESVYSWQDDQTIYGAAGSYAEAYAMQNGIHFIPD